MIGNKGQVGVNGQKGNIGELGDKGNKGNDGTGFLQDNNLNYIINSNILPKENFIIDNDTGYVSYNGNTANFSLGNANSLWESLYVKEIYISKNLIYSLDLETGERVVESKDTLTGETIVTVYDNEGNIIKTSKSIITDNNGKIEPSLLPFTGINFKGIIIPKPISLRSSDELIGYFAFESENNYYNDVLGELETKFMEEEDFIKSGDYYIISLEANLNTTVDNQLIIINNEENRFEFNINYNKFIDEEVGGNSKENNIVNNGDIFIFVEPRFYKINFTLPISSIYSYHFELSSHLVI